MYIYLRITDQPSPCPSPPLNQKQSVTKVFFLCSYIYIYMRLFPFAIQNTIIQYKHCIFYLHRLGFVFKRLGRFCKCIALTFCCFFQQKYFKIVQPKWKDFIVLQYNSQTFQIFLYTFVLSLVQSFFVSLRFLILLTTLEYLAKKYCRDLQKMRANFSFKIFVCR